MGQKFRVLDVQSNEAMLAFTLQPPLVSRMLLSKYKMFTNIAKINKRCFHWHLSQ